MKNLKIKKTLKNSVLYIILLIALVASCGGNSNQFTLKGSFKGLDNGEFFCFSSSPEWGTFDTIKINGGDFSITHQLSDTVILTLQYPNFMQTQVIAIPGEDVTLKGDASNMLRIKVSGDENEELSDFRKSIVKLKDKEVVAAAEKYILDNPHLWVSIAIFETYFLNAEKPDYAKIDKLINAMLKVRPQRKALLNIKSQLGGTLNCKVGGKLPKFSAKTIKGEEVNNATFANKAVLITFWSTMTSELRYPILHQRSTMRKFSDRLTQLNICIDVDTADCVKTLRNDTIGGYNVCDRQTFDSPLVILFGAKQIPSNILVDEKGIVRARDIDPEQLESELAKYGIK